MIRWKLAGASLLMFCAMASRARAQPYDDAAVTNAIVEALYQVRTNGECASGSALDCVVEHAARGHHNDECMQHAYTYAATLRRGLSLSEAHRQIDVGNSSIGYSTAARGCKVADLGQAIASGELRPGMLIHTKAHWFVDVGRAGYESGWAGKGAARHRRVRRHVSSGHADTCDNDAHHWALYVGRRGGRDLFVDNTTFTPPPPARRNPHHQYCESLASSAEVWTKCTHDLAGYVSEIGSGWQNSRWYGAAPDGLPPITLPVRVYAIHDPLRGQRTPRTATAPACAAAARAELASAGGPGAIPGCQNEGAASAKSGAKKKPAKKPAKKAEKPFRRP